MPNNKKNKRKGDAPSLQSWSLNQSGGGGGEVIRNVFAVGDDVDPRESLRYMQDMFKGKIDPDVVAMIFSECAYDVDQALESLISLTSYDSSSPSMPPKAESSDYATMNESVVPQAPGSKNSEFSYCSDQLNEVINPIAERCDLKNSETEINSPSSSSTSDYKNLFFKYLESPDHKIFEPANYKAEHKESTEIHKIKSVAQENNDQSVLETKNVTELFSEGFVSTPGSHGYRSQHMSSSLPFYSPEVQKNRHSFPNTNHNITLLSFDSQGNFITPCVPSQHNKKVPSPPKLKPFLIDQNYPQGNNENTNHVFKVDEIKTEVENGLKVLIILRGLPGSGKTTLGREIKNGGVVYSTDDYFYKSGRYLMDFTRLSHAHEWNRIRTLKAMRKGFTPIIIDNTNLEAWEMIPYVDLGLQFCYKMHLLEPNTPWKYKLNKLARKNLHNVSKEKIERMLERFDRNVSIEDMISLLKRKKPTDYFERDNVRVETQLDTHKGIVASNTASGIYTAKISSGDKGTVAGSSNSSAKSDSDDSLQCTSSCNEALKVISLEAVIHREDENASVFSPSTTQNVSHQLNDNSMLNAVGLDSNVCDVEGEKSVIVSNTKDTVCERIEKINDLNELRDLLRENSEEPPSRTTSSTNSSEDITGWEAITEPDEDFQWSSTVPSTPCSSLGSRDRQFDKFNDKPKNNGESNNHNFDSEKQEVENFNEAANDGHDESSTHVIDKYNPDGTRIIFSCLTGCTSDKDYVPKPPRSRKTSYSIQPDANDNRENVLEPQMSQKLSLPLPLHTQKSHANDNNNVIIACPNSDFDTAYDSNLSEKDVSQCNENIIPLAVASIEPEPHRKPLLKESSLCKIENCEEESTGQEVETPKKREKSRIAADLGELTSLFEKYKNWSFPPAMKKDENLCIFPVEKEGKKSFFSCSQTQTEPTDFVTLYQIQNNPLYVTSMKILVPSGIVCATVFPDDKEDVIPMFACLDKGTSTDDLETKQELSNSIDLLRTCFPEISDDDFKHLLEICHHDTTWLCNILVEWGYKYNVPKPKDEGQSASPKSLEKCDKQTNEYGGGKDSSETRSSDAETERSMEDQQNDSGIRSTTDSDQMFRSQPSSSSSNFENQMFTLTLDAAFASQLEMLFGPVSENEDRFLPENLVLNVDLNLAKHMYHRWRATLEHSPELLANNPCDDSVSCLEKSITPASKNMKIQLFMDMMNKSGEPLPLSQIMDMEQALQLHYEEEIKKSAVANNMLSSKLKRLELYKMFPGVDPLALDSVFEANNYSLKQTVLALEEDVGKPAKLPAEAAGDEEMTENDPFKDFVTENWSDWIHQDGFAENEDMETLPEEAITSPEVESIRAQAAMHYQLRQECIKKAQSAFRKRMGEVASYYSQKGEFHLTKFREANRKASALILENKNKGHGSLILDLHGLYVQEAIKALTKFLNRKKAELINHNSSEQTSVTIITGRGAHSLRVPKLRPSVMSYLNSNGYRFDEINLGVFNVHLSAYG